MKFSDAICVGLEVLLRAVVSGPIMVLLVGFGVMMAGYITCEYLMIRDGMAANSYFPYEKATMIAGFILWALFALRCIDFRRLDYFTTFSDEHPFRVYWILAFATSSIACLALLNLVCGFEIMYVREAKPDFVWSVDMIWETMKAHPVAKWTLIVSTALTAALSIPAVIDDRRRDELFVE